MIWSGYTFYKNMFECCDKFNRNLHEIVFPDKQGERGECGSDRTLLGLCIPQNTYNAYRGIFMLLKLTFQQRFKD